MKYLNKVCLKKSCVSTICEEFKRGGTKGVSGHTLNRTLNQTFETPGRGGGARKTYKTKQQKKIIVLTRKKILSALKFKTRSPGYQAFV